MIIRKIWRAIEGNITSLCTMKNPSLLVVVLLVFVHSIAQAIPTNSAYIKLYSQITEIEIDDSIPVTKTTYEIVLKFNDEKAITLHHGYTVNYSFFDKLEKIEAYTENPQPNGKMKTIEIKEFVPNNSQSSGIFFDDQQEININFLGLTVGSEAHVKYTLTTREAHYTDPMVFRSYLPVEKQFYKLTVPAAMKITLIEKNVPKGLVQYTKEEKRNEVVHTWTADNVDEDKDYDGAPARLYYTPHILYKIDEFTKKGKTITVSKSPEDLFRWYVSHIRNVNKKPSERIQQLADSIAKGAVTESEKVRRVYEWIQHNIRYVAFEAGMEGLVPRDGETVCIKRYGDCKDMSSLHFVLLRAMNIPCYMTSIGTRRIPYTYSEVPLKNSDNHMIAAVKLNGQWVFLDATDPNGIFGLPTDHIQGKQAMIYLSDTNFELATVPVISAKQNVVRDSSVFYVKNNDVDIHRHSTYEGLLAGNLANDLHYLTENEKNDFAKGQVKNIQNNAILNTYEFPKQVRDDAIDLKFDFSIKDYCKEQGNEKYLNLNLDKLFMNSMIKEAGRDVPMAFKYNMSNEQTVILNLPTGYQLTYVPENVSFKQADFEFTIQYTREADKLICRQHTVVDFPDLMIKPSQFESWNQCIKLLNKAYKESIILEKK